MSYRVGQWSLEKLFIEVRFENCEAFFRQRDPLIRYFLLRYPSKADDAETLAMANPDLQRKVVFQMNRAVLDFDQVADLDGFSEEVRRMQGALREVLNVEVFNRVGVRGYWTVAMTSYEALEHTKRQMLRISEKWAKVGKLRGARVFLHFAARDDLMLNINVGSVEIRRVELTGNQPLIDDRRDVLMADVDAYREGRNLKLDLVTFVVEYRDIVERAVLPALWEG